MYLGIRVMKQGPGYDDMIRQLNMVGPTLEEGLLALGNATKSKMSMTIKQNKKRPGSNNVLEGAIQVYKDTVTKTRVDIGIGNTNELDLIAPYWYFINYGISKNGMIIPGRGKNIPGYFGSHQPPIRGGNMLNEQFHYVKGGQGTFFMTPKNPITPMNYIEKTIAWVASIKKITFDKMNSIINISRTQAANIQGWAALTSTGSDYY